MPKLTNEDRRKSYDFIKLSDLYMKVIMDTGVPGTMCLVTTHSRLPMPVACVWYMPTPYLHSELIICNSYVDGPARRRGIRTEMNKELFRRYSKVTRIVSLHGTEDGTPWMMATGYKQHKEGYFYVTRAAFTKKNGPTKVWV